MSEDTTKNDDTTVEDDLQETAGYIEVVMPDGSRTTSTLLKLHVKAIKARTDKGDYPSDAVLFLIEKGDGADAQVRRMQFLSALSGMNIPGK